MYMKVSWFAYYIIILKLLLYPTMQDCSLKNLHLYHIYDTNCLILSAVVAIFFLPFKHLIFSLSYGIIQLYDILHLYEFQGGTL